MDQEITDCNDPSTDIDMSILDKDPSTNNEISNSVMMFPSQHASFLRPERFPCKCSVSIKDVSITCLDHTPASGHSARMSLPKESGSSLSTSVSKLSPSDQISVPSISMNGFELSLPTRLSTSSHGIYPRCKDICSEPSKASTNGDIVAAYAAHGTASNPRELSFDQLEIEIDDVGGSAAAIAIPEVVGGARDIVSSEESTTDDSGYHDTGSFSQEMSCSPLAEQGLYDKPLRPKNHLTPGQSENTTGTEVLANLSRVLVERMADEVETFVTYVEQALSLRSPVFSTPFHSPSNSLSLWCAEIEEEELRYVLNMHCIAAAITRVIINS